VQYTITPTADRRVIALGSLNGTEGAGETDLAVEFLQQALIRHLNHAPGLTTGHRSDVFFDKRPDVPYRDSGRPGNRNPPNRSDVDIFRGFTFRVAPIANIGLCVALDVRTSYVGRKTLADYLRDGMPPHIESDWGGCRWVNDYGILKQAVYLVRVLEDRIGEITRGDRRSTYDYLHTTYPQIRGRITPQDRAAMIMYKVGDAKSEDRHYPAAATLLKPKFTNKHPEVRALGDTAAFPPQERWNRVNAARTHLDGFLLDHVRVAIGTPLSPPSSVLPLPDLLFGPPEAPTRLRPGERFTGDGDARRRWGQRKMQALQQSGPYRKQPFINPVLVYPASLERDHLLDDILKRTQEFCAKYGGVVFEPEFNPYQDAAHPRDVVAKLKGIADGGRAGFILLALPANPAHADRVYTGVKTQVVLPSKCFASQKARQRAHNERDFASYIERNALGMLVENGVRPWGLGTPLAYEVQIGLDVARFKHGGLMGAAAILDATASDIVFANREIDARERIPAPIVGKYVLEQLDRFYNSVGRAPHKILFQRDGRLLEPERKGIRSALRKFAERYPDEPRPEWAAITIEKGTAIPLRLFAQAGDRVERVLSGSYFLQNPTSAYLVLAGAPSLRIGTPAPVRVQIVDSGDAQPPAILPIIDDIFKLSQLNWNAPEIDISLPITLRRIDQKLERYALEFEEDEDADGGWEDNEDE